MWGADDNIKTNDTWDSCLLVNTIVSDSTDYTYISCIGSDIAAWPKNGETTQASSTNKPEGGGTCLHHTVSHAEAQTDGPVPDGRVRPTERCISRESLEHGQRKTAKKTRHPTGKWKSTQPVLYLLYV